MARPRSYSQEYRDEAVKMVIETSRPIAVVARELGLLDGTLGNWVNAYRKTDTMLRTAIRCAAGSTRPGCPRFGLQVVRSGRP